MMVGEFSSPTYQNFFDELLVGLVLNIIAGARSHSRQEQAVGSAPLAYLRLSDTCS
jgi:hypothetical protein